MGGYKNGKVEIFYGDNPPSNLNILWQKRIVTNDVESSELMQYNNNLSEWESLKNKTIQDQIDAMNSLSGTNYVMVYGVGTPTENGAELLAAYNAAKNMPRYLGQIFGTFEGTLYKGQTFLDDVDVYRIVDVTHTHIDGIITDTTEIAEAQAKSVRSTVIVAPGDYHFTTSFLIDTIGINIVSLTGNADIVIATDDNNGVSVHIQVPIFLKGLNTIYRLKLDDDLIGLVCENCIAIGEYSFSSYGVGGTSLNGTFKNCIGGDYAWTSDNLSVSCYCYNCAAGSFSFGWSSDLTNILYGYYENCSATSKSFQVLDSTCIVKNCIVREIGDSNNESFNGSGAGNGKFIGCQCPTGDVWSSSSTGYITYCINGDGSAANNVSPI